MRGPAHRAALLVGLLSACAGPEAVRGALQGGAAILKLLEAAGEAGEDLVSALREVGPPPDPAAPVTTDSPAAIQARLASQVAAHWGDFPPASAGTLAVNEQERRVELASMHLPDTALSLTARAQAWRNEVELTVVTTEPGWTRSRQQLAAGQSCAPIRLRLDHTWHAGNTEVSASNEVGGTLRLDRRTFLELATGATAGGWFCGEEWAFTPEQLESLRAFIGTVRDTERLDEVPPTGVAACDDYLDRVAACARVSDFARSSSAWTTLGNIWRDVHEGQISAKQCKELTELLDDDGCP